jgi:hypothetical protein
VASILERDLDATISFWWGLVEKEKERSRIPLPPEERTAHLPTLIRDVIVRLRLPRSGKVRFLTPHATMGHFDVNKVTRSRCWWKSRESFK